MALHIENGVLLRYEPDGSPTVTVPEGVHTIGEKAFCSCKQVFRITLPRSIRVLGDWAFLACSNLSQLTLPDDIEVIPARCFLGCTSLQRVELPSSLQRIGSLAFQGCRQLRGLVLPPSLRQIAGEAFAGCTSLQSVTVPESVEKVGAFAFMGCHNLHTLSFARMDMVFAYYDYGTFGAYPDFLKKAGASPLPLSYDRDFSKAAPRYRPYMALARLQHPVALQPEYREQYNRYLTEHTEEAVRVFLEDENADGLRFLMEVGAITEENRFPLCQIAAELHKTGLQLLLMNGKKRRPPTLSWD